MWHMSFAPEAEVETDPTVNARPYKFVWRPGFPLEPARDGPSPTFTLPNLVPLGPLCSSPPLGECRFLIREGQRIRPTFFLCDRDAWDLMKFGTQRHDQDLGFRTNHFEGARLNKGALLRFRPSAEYWWVAWAPVHLL